MLQISFVSLQYYMPLYFIYLIISHSASKMQRWESCF